MGPTMTDIAEMAINRFAFNYCCSKLYSPNQINHLPKNQHAVTALPTVGTLFNPEFNFATKLLRYDLVLVQKKTPPSKIE